MISINLLPAEKKRLGIGTRPLAPVATALILIVLGVVALSFYLAYLNQNLKQSINEKNKQIAQIKKQNAEYDRLINKLNQIRPLLTEIKEIEQQSDILYQTLKLVKENTPTDVQFTSLTLNNETENNIVIAGKAMSARAAARFRAAFDQVDWVQKALLSSITIAEDDSAQFSLTLTVSNIEK